MDARPIRLPRRGTQGAAAEGRSSPRSQSTTTRAAASQSPRLARFEIGSVIAQTPDERMLRIDVNGCLAGAVRAIPDAPRELAVGWAFMQGFFEASDALGRISVRDDRISIMVDGGGDLDRLRMEAAGLERPSRSRLAASFPPRTERLAMDEVSVSRLAEEGFHQFRKDGAVAGYAHAGIASAQSVHCVARDLVAETAVAKVLGWVLCEERHQESRVLIVRGMVDQRLVRAAARCGIELIISDSIPSAPAVREALRLPLSIVGMATSRRLGLFVDGGHIA
jgi:formate dehydrogenase accessory protein FdhD